MRTEGLLRGSTPRVQDLIKEMLRHAKSDRTGEWFDKLPSLALSLVHGKDEPLEFEDIIIRRARAFQLMLEQLTIPDEEWPPRSQKHTYEIVPGELIVGVCPLGSLGIGGAFPNYLTPEEQRVGFLTSQDYIGSVIGHNVVDYSRVLKTGLKGILDDCERRLKELEGRLDSPGVAKFDRIESKKSFYRAVEICCNAVVAYANKFADLAKSQADKTSSEDRRNELHKIEKICRKVPYYAPETFHEALQSIWFMHLAMHATINRMSLGRLDQALQPFYERSVNNKEITEAEAVELLECFLIKASGRLNLNVSTYRALDHTDYGAIVNAQPDLIDFRCDINNFWQQLVVGGKTKEGKDATNDCTYLILRAFASSGIATPVVYARIHKYSPKAYLKEIAKTLVESGTNQPILYNDEVIVESLQGLPQFPPEYALDYAADGCWEPVPQGVTDWTLGIVIMPHALECALNSGALISDNPEFLRGEPISTQTPRADKIKLFSELKDYVNLHMQHLIDKLVLSFYKYYLIPGASVPVPFYSALSEGCMEKGRDKTWAGTTFVLAGVIAAGLPNLANSLAAIHEWVYERHAYTLPEVLEILRCNFVNHEQTQREFLSSPKFGNVTPSQTSPDGDPNLLMRELLQSFSNALEKAKNLAEHVFLDDDKLDDNKGRRLSELRRMADYVGPSMRKIFGEDFQIRLSAGCGTFELYAFLGKGCAASADGRGATKPLAPNFSPTSGTIRDGLGSFLESLDGLNLKKFGAGAMSDVSLSKKDASNDYLINILTKFVMHNGSILSINLVDSDELIQLYELSEEVREGRKDHSTLDDHLDVTVRVGGFQAQFVTMTREQQQDYLSRGVRA